MKVLITGGTGDIGTALSKRLYERSWDIRLIGLEETAPFDNAHLGDVDYAQCDIMDFENLKKQMQGCDAVIHLAAIRAPILAPSEEVFRVNVAGTFNVYEAAAQTGITRVVQASSINAIGCGWSIAELHPQYFPVDEDHPRVTNDAYSFSKQMVEDVAAYFYRRDGISGTSLRFPWVYNREKHLSDDYFARRETVKAELETLFHQSEADRRARLEPLKAEVLAFRKARRLEYAQAQTQPPFSNAHDDPLWQVSAFDRFNYFTLLDDRDAAQALEKSLTAGFEGSQYEGSHPLFVMDAHNALGLESAKLAHLFYPEVTKQSLSGSESLVSSDKARALLGFEPEFSLHAGSLEKGGAGDS